MDVAAAMARLFAAVSGSNEADMQSNQASSSTPPSPDTLGRYSKVDDEDAIVRSAAYAGPPASSASTTTIPIERHLFVYCAGSRGLATVAQAHGPKIMAALGIAKPPYIIKCGTTVLPLSTRLEQIGKDQYGAATRGKKGLQIEPGFVAWIAHSISTSRRPRDPAVTLLPRAVAVDLPSGLTRRAFDTALHRALKKRALDSLATATMPRRLVAYDLVEQRIGVAQELYALCPHDHADGDLLLDAIEGILERFRAGRS